MPGLTAIYNASGCEGLKVHLYYNTRNKNLGLQFRGEGPKVKNENEITIAADDSGCNPGYIPNASFLSSTFYNGIELVFGLSDQLFYYANDNNGNNGNNGNGCGPEKRPRCYDVSLVSPVYQVLDTVSDKNVKIASCSSDSQAWVFFLTNDPENGLSIREAGYGGSSTATFTDTTKILPTSALAAYFSQTRGRSVIYQANASNKLLHEYNVDKEDKIINASDNAKPGTSLAICATETTVYLYYVNNNNQLRKLTKSIDADCSGWKAGAEIQTDQVDPDSQLTVTIGDGSNHIFYKAVKQNPNTKFTHVVDKQ